MTSNLMEETDNHKMVNVADCLASEGVIKFRRKITELQYSGWLNQHALTFVDARYAGQCYHNIEIAFLFHLATQCKVLARYVIKREIGNLNEESANYVMDAARKEMFHNSHELSDVSLRRR